MNESPESDPVADPPDLRFVLANERTFLAWTRTALALIGAGLALTQLPGGGPVEACPIDHHGLSLPMTERSASGLGRDEVRSRSAVDLAREWGPAGGRSWGSHGLPPELGAAAPRKILDVPLPLNLLRPAPIPAKRVPPVASASVQLGAGLPAADGSGRTRGTRDRRIAGASAGERWWSAFLAGLGGGAARHRRELRSAPGTDTRLQNAAQTVARQ